MVDINYCSKIISHWHDATIHDGTIHATVRSIHVSMYV